jgi:hypothetical protein
VAADVSAPAGYPANWQEIRTAVRARSGGRCECIGECGLHDGTPSPECWAFAASSPHERCSWPRTCECWCHGEKPADATRCEERDGQPAIWARGRVVLTTAHLCHDPGCDRLEHLRQMCNRCHLRYDRGLHQRHARERRRRERATAGALELFDSQTDGSNGTV